MDFDRELQQTVDELAGRSQAKAVRPNGGQHAMVTPRVESAIWPDDPQQYDFARLGETVAASLVQTAQEQANRANVMLEQARELADEIRSKIADKNRELAEMNRQLSVFGEKVLAAARDS